MPLKVGSSKSTFEENLRRELDAGKSLKQSLAIAYSKKREAERKAGKSITPNKNK